MARDIAGVGDERDAASRAPPRGTGRWAPAARAREAPDGRGEGAGRCRQARRQSPDRLDRNLLSWAASEPQGMGEEEGARARDDLSRQTHEHVAQKAERSASEPPPSKLTSQKTAAPNADKLSDSTAPSRCIPALQDRDFSEGAGRAKSSSFQLRHLLG